MILELLRKDEEIKQLRDEWKKTFNECFPLFNFDQFGGVDDYKAKIKYAIETNNPEISYLFEDEYKAIFENKDISE